MTKELLDMIRALQPHGLREVLKAHAKELRIRSDQYDDLGTLLERAGESPEVEWECQHCKERFDYPEICCGHRAPCITPPADDLFVADVKRRLAVDKPVESVDNPVWGCDQCGAHFPTMAGAERCHPGQTVAPTPTNPGQHAQKLQDQKCCKGTILDDFWYHTPDCPGWGFNGLVPFPFRLRIERGFAIAQSARAHAMHEVGKDPQAEERRVVLGHGCSVTEAEYERLRGTHGIPASEAIHAVGKDPSTDPSAAIWMGTLADIPDDEWNQLFGKDEGAPPDPEWSEDEQAWICPSCSETWSEQDMARDCCPERDLLKELRALNLKGQWQCPKGSSPAGAWRAGGRSPSSSAPRRTRSPPP